jgi:hypothetical protein
MKLRNVPRLTVFFLSVCHLLGGCAYACFICPNFPILGPIVQAVEKAPVVGQLVKGANDGAGAIAKGGADVLTGAVKVGVGLTKIVTGDPNGRQEI